MTVQLAYVLAFMSLPFSALLQIIQIRIEQPTMHLENDLAIVCYISNPGDNALVFSLELQMNKTGSFQRIVFMYSDDKDIWKDPVLQNISKVSGSLYPPSSAELRLTIDKKKMQCPDDFAMFRCKVRGFDQVTHNVEEQFTEPISVSYCTLLPSIQIRTEQQQMHLENDLAIVCYISNPGDIASVFSLELQMNKTGSFQRIVFMYSDDKDIWKDPVLQNISKVSGSLYPPSSAELRLTIDKKKMQCPDDFAMFRCKVRGFDQVTHNVEEQFTEPISVSYCTLLPSIQIRTEQPQMHIENDLAIVCYISNPGDIASVFSLELQMNKTGSFQRIVFMYSDGKDIWKDPVLQNISKVSGSLYPPSSAELRLTIDKKKMQCPDDFAMFRCKVRGFDQVTHNVEEQFTEPISVSYCTLLPSIQIRTEQPQMHIENDLAIVCYISNPGDIASVFSLELQMNKTGSFQRIVFMYSDGKDIWKDPVLQNISKVSGSLYPPSSAELRLTIDKKKIQCQDAIAMFRCKMRGFDQVTHNVEEQFTEPISVSYCALLLSIQIRADQPQMHLENDLAIVCYISNPGNIASVFSLELQMNKTGSFQRIVFMYSDDKDIWKDAILQNISKVSGSLSSPSSAELRLVIDKKNIQCPDDFAMFRCKMRGFDQVTHNVEEKFTEPISVSYCVSSVQSKRHGIPPANYAGVIVIAAIGIVILVASGLLWKRHRYKREIYGDDNIYTDFKVYDLIRESIPLRRFVEHVEYLMKNDKEELNEEFKALLNSHEKDDKSAATDLGVISKKELERSNSIPYEFNRVKLQRQASGSKKDYINASLLLDGLYIMTQCPTQKKTANFWQMIWEHHVPSIVVLSADREQRQECYFPDRDGEVHLYGRIDVELLATYKESRDITWRNFKLTKENQSKTVTHFSVSNVEMCRVQEQLLNLMDILTRTNKKIDAKGPCVVHGGCYGMDYSSVFIVVDHLVKSTVSGSSSVDVYGTVTRLLKERMFSIDSEDQYCMIYNCLQSYFQNSTEVYGGTTVKHAYNEVPIMDSTNVYEDLY
ncbi:uncharacterized protein LOC128186234 [Crassostrea angulata]|uniref:uncharacterized protein LOC128186234 n=1 Tax=Magallana angulata TaxID=2784310 RepID=UPI0022B1E615|nr:uncharacterized protein LOC128186234 [Crassostrea angulata]